MPTLLIDTEAAALIDVATTMLQSALRARSERADPEKIITDSLQLQANKLEVVMAQLYQPDPPDFSRLDSALRSQAIDLMQRLAADPLRSDRDALWNQLRRLAVTPGFPARPRA